MEITMIFARTFMFPAVRSSDSACVRYRISLVAEQSQSAGDIIT